MMSPVNSPMPGINQNDPLIMAEHMLALFFRRGS